MNTRQDEEPRGLPVVDRQAFERFVKRWDTEVLNLAYRLTGHREDALDIRQAAFLRAYSALGDFKGRSSMGSWLYRIVLNLCRDQLRNRQVRERTTQEVAVKNSTDLSLVPAADTTSEMTEMQRSVAEAIMSLPAAEREIVILRHYHEIAFTQISQILDLPVTTVKTRMTRALRRLRGLLETVASCSNI